MSKFSLKEYQSQLQKKQAEREILMSDLTSIQMKLSQNKQEIAGIEKEIHTLKQKQVEPVTEHAILRYLERVVGIDLVDIKKQIMGHVKPLYPMSGEIKGVINDKKVRFIIKQNQVITVSDC